VPQRLPHNVRCLLSARAVRSIGQGATVASFSLYLHALGFSGAAIGLVLMAGSGGAIVFAAAAWLQRMDELRQLLAGLRRKTL